MTAEAATAVAAQGRPRWLELAVALRPYQWPKNGLVFAALAFSAGTAWEFGETQNWWPLLWPTALTFVAWCIAASAVYLVNDTFDRHADQLHPVKRNRPIARGVVSPRTAVSAATVLAVAAVAIAVAVDWLSGAVLAGYVLGMVAYSAGLKAIALLDVLALTGGVIARAVSGAAAIDVEISPWLYVCTGFAAFFVATSKRWAEFRELGEGAARHRAALDSYTSELLTQMLAVSAGAALLSYALYSIESENAPTSGAMALTIPFVGFAMFRYLQLLSGKRRGDAPDRILFTDPAILVAVAGFVAVALAVLASQ